MLVGSQSRDAASLQSACSVWAVAVPIYISAYLYISICISIHLYITRQCPLPHPSALWTGGGALWEARVAFSTYPMGLKQTERLAETGTKFIITVKCGDIKSRTGQQKQSMQKPTAPRRHRSGSSWASQTPFTSRYWTLTPRPSISGAGPARHLRSIHKFK